MTVAGLAFLGSGRRLDYGRRLVRRRWRGAVRAPCVKEVLPQDPAREAFGPGGVWVVVRNEAALPICPAQVPPPGRRVLVTWHRSPSDPPFVHTLRELEEAVSSPLLGPPPRAEAVAALLFDVAVFPPFPGETAGVFLERLLASQSVAVESGFGALPLGASRGIRPEVTRHVPREARRLLDVGCGSGEAGAALKSSKPDLVVWGVEKDPALAREAGSHLDRVFEGDAQDILARLAAEAAPFDAFLFADILEHLVDPIGTLAQARTLALPGATLVASVPNVGHLSVVRDVLRGRFDPVPAGLLDAGHLRWFTRRTLIEALEESGWEVRSVEAERGAPPPDAEAFLRWADALPGADRQSLETYQWIAVARA